MAQQGRVVYNQNFDNQNWNWGYYLGLNYFNFKISPTEAGLVNNELAIDVNPVTGFMVGLIGNKKINDYLRLRFEPGLDYTTRVLSYRRKLLNEFYTTSYRTRIPANDSIRKVHSTYVRLPILLKFGGVRKKNIKPYIIGGASLGIDLASNQNAIDDNLVGIDGFRTKTLNLFWEAGGGIDWYLPYFKLSTEIRGSFGIFNEKVDDDIPNTPWTSTIDKLNTRAVFFVLKFE